MSTITGRSVFRHQNRLRGNPQPISIARKAGVQRLQVEPFSQLVAQATNHLRNLWARAGYPGLRERDIKKAGKFLAHTRAWRKACA